MNAKDEDAKFKFECKKIYCIFYRNAEHLSHLRK